ncbi:MAG: ABC transporter ATP-binding protein, partial [Clostridia bacterium]|nr:ABC transporter ATP-binding protein [Clostridia bacterium]
MINLRSVGKVYFTEDKKTDALKDVNINFRRSEFVCILGPSGCGKTTLLNIIGGLDRYTSGEITVDGRSTASFTDAEWDGYRSEKVGFVFQSYNLIPHQTVIENVETALAISGVGKQERRKRALKALVEVGLEEHLRKRPRQLSGGEMQRVAIARAIVKNPDIILADEPTGALDSKNSVQIMDLLARISKDRLVVTVTHNDELAKKYATRIIKISDGKVISDSDPFTGDEKKEERLQAKRSVMPYSLAARLSFKNLLGKKVRTFLTCFASAIAIVGISLVAACSNGLNAFIDKVQKDTMSGTPVTVSASARNYTTYINSLFGYVGSGGKQEITDEGEQVVIPTNSVWVNHVLKSALTERIVNFITEDYLRYLKGLDQSRVSYDAIYSASRFVYKKVSANLNGSSRQINAVVSTSNNWGQIPENT